MELDSRSQGYLKGPGCPVKSQGLKEPTRKLEKDCLQWPGQREMASKCQRTSPARLHHAPADPRLQGHCHVPGERQPERGAQPPPGRAECHPGAPAGASGRLGPAAERRDQLPAELQAAGEALPQGETDQLHPAPVLPPRLPPLPQRHSPELLRGDPQQDGVPQLPRPQRHLGAALARRAPGGRLRPGTADEIPHNHPGPAVFPQHHLCQHPAGSERQDRKSQQPIASSAGAGAGPGEPRPAGHGPGHLPVHGRELLAWAAGPCHPMDRGDGPVIFCASITTLWRQGTDPSSPRGVRGWIHHLAKDPATLRGSTITLGRQGLDPSFLHRDRGWIHHPPVEAGTKAIPPEGCTSPVPQALLPKDTSGFPVLSQLH